MHICTLRLELIASKEEMVRAELDGGSAIVDLLDAQIHSEWPPEHWDRPAMEWTLRSIESGISANGWGMWYWVLNPPHVTQRTLIGNGGFKGPPDDRGVVELGYSVVSEHRRRGLATEACRALIGWSLLDPRVRTITAETYPHLTPSLGVMGKLGMTLLSDGSEPGVVRYGIDREQVRF